MVVFVSIVIERGEVHLHKIIFKLRQYDKFYIYGAQVVAYGTYCAIKHLTGRVPQAFLVRAETGNPENIDGIKVMSLQMADRAALIIVAVTELLQNEIIDALQELNFRHAFRLTAHEEHLLMSSYFGDIGMFFLTERVKDSKADVDFALYEVCNHRDKTLENHPQLAAFEHPIQAGATLVAERRAEIGDDTGDNISAKNKQYCEMTATYWVWKNTHHAWKGIEHYRRHLLVKPDMLTEDVDAILPLPYICYPNTLAQFRRFVSEAVLQALLQALKDLHPDEYEAYLAILRGQYQYTYNLVCAREDVFDDYCTWFFHITEYMENMADLVPEIGNTRALSYVAEVLTNLYFMSHQDRWQIRHVEKAIYV